MHKQKKVQVISELKQDLTGVSMCMVAHYSGLTAAKVVSLRQAGRKENFCLRVAKNSLLKIATEGSSYESLRDSFTGPVIIAYTKDEDYLPMVKTLTKFEEKNKAFTLVAGSICGTSVNQQGLLALSKLPSFEELRRRLLFSLLAPATTFVTVLQRPAQELVRVLNAKVKLAETK